MADFCCKNAWLRPIELNDLSDGPDGIGIEDARCTVDKCDDTAFYTAGGFRNGKPESWLLCNEHGWKFAITNGGALRDLFVDDDDD